MKSTRLIHHDGDLLRRPTARAIWPCLRVNEDLPLEQAWILTARLKSERVQTPAVQVFNALVGEPIVTLCDGDCLPRLLLHVFHVRLQDAVDHIGLNEGIPHEFYRCVNQRLRCGKCSPQGAFSLFPDRWYFGLDCGFVRICG